MKVVIVSTGYPRWRNDHSHIYLHRLAVSLVKLDVEVHIVAPHAEGLKKEELLDGVYIHRFQYMFPARFQSLAYFPGIPEKIKTFSGKLQVVPFMFCMGAKTLKCIKEFDIDIISANWAIPPGFVSTILKSIHRKPILLILYGAELFPLLRRNNIFNNICKVMAKYAITNSSAVAGISVATCDAGMKLSGRSDLKILTDGIDVEVFNPYIDASDIKLKYKNDYIIFTSGRMVERKGFRYLLESIPYVLREIPNCKFILGGEGPEKVSLQETAKKLGVVNHVIFPGYISNEDFPKYLKACDIFVLPSIIDKSGDTEGLGIPLIEAMACGTPVIGTNVGGIPFIINDGIGGYLIDEKNPKQLANKIILLLRDMNLRRNISEKGLIYVKDKFSSDKIAEDYIELFKSLVR